MCINWTETIISLKGRKRQFFLKHNWYHDYEGILFVKTFDEIMFLFLCIYRSNYSGTRILLNNSVVFHDLEMGIFLFFLFKDVSKTDIKFLWRNQWSVNLAHIYCTILYHLLKVYFVVMLTGTLFIDSIKVPGCKRYS